LEDCSYRWAKPQTFHSDQRVSISPPVTSWQGFKQREIKISCLVEGAATDKTSGGADYEGQSNIGEYLRAYKRLKLKSGLSRFPMSTACLRPYSWVAKTPMRSYNQIEALTLPPGYDDRGQICPIKTIHLTLS